MMMHLLGLRDARRAAPGGALAIVALALGVLAVSQETAAACPGLEPCVFAEGDYYALPPPGWDGERSLPATIFFHGYGARAIEFAQDPAFTGAFAAEGVLLVLPDSDGPSWGRRGPEARGRDEFAFTAALRADLLRRFPVDPHRLLVSGFSAGAGLTLDLACNRGRDYAGFVVIAGAFRAPVPESCPSGPVSLLQIHGVTDDALPPTGVVLGGRVRLADIFTGMAALRRIDGCPEPPTRTLAGPSAQSCLVWDRCASGRELDLCLHPEGHVMPEGWVHQAETWLLAQAPAAE
jgi:polyhydroxybutyrate depolymerase